MNERSVANVDSSIDFDKAIESADVDSDAELSKSMTSKPASRLHPYSTLCYYGTDPSVSKHSMKAGVSSFKRIHSLDHLDKVHMAERTVVIYKQATPANT